MDKLRQIAMSLNTGYSFNQIDYKSYYPRTNSTMKHLISSEQIDQNYLMEIFSIADYMERIANTKGRIDLLSDKVVALLFYESSSRTLLSFQSAAARLGANIILTQGNESSSLKKRESIEDTIRVISGYCDLIVMRHSQMGSAEKAANASSIPFINGGDGGNEHPTQAMIDMYTIYKELGRIDNLHITFGFDPKYSRSIHSLALLISKYKNLRMTFISPEELTPQRALIKVLENRGVQVEITSDIGLSNKGDVLYLNRLQEERFDDYSIFDKYCKEYSIKKNMFIDNNIIILDPLPRVDEISPEVDTLPNAMYFKQAKNGIPLRMALLAKMLERI